MANILIVDDEKNIRTHLATYIGSLGHVVATAEDAALALRALAQRDFDVVLSDVRMAGMDGLALLREIRRRRPEAVVALMTAYATVPEAVEAMRAGAYDYLVKPFSLDQVGLLLARVLEVQALRRENETLRRALHEPVWLESASPVMQRALATAQQAAGSDVTVLLTGESGTGKNVLARAMHSWSRRAQGPFITIACTTLAEHLLGERVVRPRERRFHRRLEGQAGTARSGGRRDGLSRRGGRITGGAAGQAAAFSRRAPFRTGGRERDHRRRCAHHRRDQP